jgi:hypothetical protein
MHFFVPVFISVLLVPGAVYAQTLVTVVNQLTNALTLFVPVSVALALTVFVWGAVVFIGKTGDDNARTTGRRRMVWGVVGLFMIVTVWGIVALMRTISGTDAGPVDCANPSIDLANGTVQTCF